MYTRTFLFIIISIFFHVDTKTTSILASDFNATYCATNPLDISDDTEIILDEDIIISTSEIVFNALTPITLTFTPQGNNKLIIANNTVWNLSTFSSEEYIVICKAPLITKGGSTILQNGGVIILQNTTWTPQGE